MEGRGLMICITLIIIDEAMNIATTAIRPMSIFFCNGSCLIMSIAAMKAINVGMRYIRLSAI
jgi:hypothetical protein